MVYCAVTLGGGVALFRCISWTLCQLEARARRSHAERHFR